MLTLRDVGQTEWLFRIIVGLRGNVPPDAMFNPRSTEEDNMKKFGYVVAALGAIAIAALRLQALKPS